MSKPDNQGKRVINSTTKLLQAQPNRYHSPTKEVVCNNDKTLLRCGATYYKCVNGLLRNGATHYKSVKALLRCGATNCQCIKTLLRCGASNCQGVIGLLRCGAAFSSFGRLKNGGCLAAMCALRRKNRHSQAKINHSSIYYLRFALRQLHLTHQH